MSGEVGNYMNGCLGVVVLALLVVVPLRLAGPMSTRRHR